MRRSVAVLAVLGLVSPLALVALSAVGLGPGFSVDEPEWKPGYTWKYHIDGTGRASGQIFGLGSAETETARLDATRRFEVVNAAVPVGDVSFYAGLQSFVLDSVKYGDDVVAEGDDGFDAMDADLSGGTFACLARCASALTLQDAELSVLMSHEPFHPGRDGPELIRLLDFPLTRDKSWTVFSFQERPDEPYVEFRATAVEMEYINLPRIDPVEAVRIEAGLTQDSRDSLRKAFREATENDEFAIDADFDIDFTYWYAPQVQNIVKMDTVSYAGGRAAGYGAAGAFRADMRLTETLTRFDLSEKPARSLDEVRALADSSYGEAPPAFSPEPWAFHAAASELSVDAAKGEPIRLGLVAGADGDDHGSAFDAVPAGTTVEWTHESYRHGAWHTERRAGETIEASPATPGLHRYTATVHDPQGRVMGADSVVVEAYTHSATTFSEPAGLAPLAPQTHGVLELAPGAVTFDIKAEATAFQGTLTIEGPDRDEAHSLGSAGRDALTLTGPLAPGAWTVGWKDDVRAGEMTITVDVRYDRGAPITTGDEWAAEGLSAAGPMALLDLLFG